MKKKNKDYTKRVRLNESERNLIMKKAQAQGRTFSSYIRYIALCEIPVDSELKKQISKLITEVNHIGHNINQIVKNNNSGLYSDMDKERLMEYMRIINEKVDLILESNGNK